MTDAALEDEPREVTSEASVPRALPMGSVSGIESEWGQHKALPRYLG